MKTIRITLWVAVALVAALIALKPIYWPTKIAEVRPGTDGRAFVDIKWEHLPDVARFELTERSGEAMDTASIAGKPFVVNIFYASCPTICRDFNSRIKFLSEKYRKEKDLTFLSITCDPENDTPEVLQKYARAFQADQERWLFLTGPMYKINEIGEQSFQVIADTAHHTDDIMLVDRWGRYRDRFKWDDEREMERFDRVLKQVLAETEPPFGKMIKTRNVMASQAAFDANRIKFLRDFRLTTSEGEDFFSRDLTGQVWVGSFFFTRCTGVCIEQNKTLSSLQKRFADEDVKLISITTKPENDSAAILRTYAKQMFADPDVWQFLTGDKDYIERVLGEFFQSHSHGDHHSTDLVLVDRWGKVRGRFDWKNELSIEKMFALARQLKTEQSPHDYLQSETNK